MPAALPLTSCSKWVEADWAGVAAQGYPSADAYRAARYVWLVLVACTLPWAMLMHIYTVASRPLHARACGSASLSSALHICMTECCLALPPCRGGWPRVHCCWNQTNTATGRLSCSAPNLQARRG